MGPIVTKSNKRSQAPPAIRTWIKENHRSVMVFTIVCTGMVLFLGALTGIYMNRLQARLNL